MATTISTHPVTGLDFPTVTVCPPKGFNTALNHDLMRMGDGALSQYDREDLKVATKAIFIDTAYRRYANNLVAAINKENLGSVYEGIASIPKPLGDRGFDIRLSSILGSIRTPLNGESDGGNQADMFSKITLNLTEILENVAVNMSLVIRLDILPCTDDSCDQEVKFTEGPPVYFHKIGKTWSDARDTCSQDGKVLPIIGSHSNMEEIAEAVFAEGWNDADIWLAATDGAEEGMWKWLDGTPVYKFTNWNTNEPNGGNNENCINMKVGYGNKWSDYKCEDAHPFVCTHFGWGTVVTENETYVYEANKLGFKSFHVQWKYQSLASKVTNIPGIILSWSLVDITNQSQKVITKPKNNEPVNKVYAKTVDLACRSRMADIPKNHVWKTFIDVKYNWSKQAIEEGLPCKDSQIEGSVVDDVLALIENVLDISEKYTIEVSEEDLVFGTKLFSVINYCSATIVEATKLAIFTESLLD